MRAIASLRLEASPHQGLCEVLRFMHLCANSDKTVTPSARVDALWHEFILFTRSYRAYCESTFGKFVHHQPSAVPDKELKQYIRTIALYERHFGEPNRTWWPKPLSISNCGTCED